MRQPNDSPRHVAGKVANASIAFGSILMALATVVLGIISKRFVETVAQDARTVPPMMFVFVSEVVLVLATGLALIVGGIGFRRLKESGRVILLASVWMLILGTVVLIGFYFTEIVGGSDPLLLRLAGLVRTIVLPGALLYLLLRAGRYFRSSAVRQLCRENNESENDHGGKNEKGEDVS